MHTVLLVTHSADHYNVDQVAAALARRGARGIRLDSDQFPTSLGLSFRLGSDGVRHSLHGPLAGVDPETVVGTWIRRMACATPPDDLDATIRVGCQRESLQTLTGFLYGLPAARVINPPNRSHAAQDKLLQLAVAREVGLRCPETLITNHPQDVRDFFEKLSGQVITKMLTPLAMSLDGSAPFVHTSRVTEEDLDHLDGLSLCPMVFQEEIARAYELRVAWVDGRYFAGRLNTGGDRVVDWRNSDADLQWSRGEVPTDVQHKLHQVMDRLELVSGAFDLMVTPQGEHVFLEVNPDGEWGMLEKTIGLPISDAYADALLGGVQ